MGEIMRLYSATRHCVARIASHHLLSHTKRDTAYAALSVLMDAKKLTGTCQQMCATCCLDM